MDKTNHHQQPKQKYMFHIPIELIENQLFQTPSSPGPIVDYTCVGYGQNPDKGTPWVVGMQFDSANNRTVLSTHLLKDVKFIGKLPTVSVKS
jgi:hypothetical protein